jgi:hypothetical protein
MCLVDLFDDALIIAQRIDSAGTYEPGPYRILSVYEKTTIYK